MYPWHLLKHKSKLKTSSDGNKPATSNAIVTVVVDTIPACGCYSATNVWWRSSDKRVLLRHQECFCKITSPKNQHERGNLSCT